MICITVSTNYDDLLDVIMPQNQRFFTKWYIVTDAQDKKTLDVIDKHNKGCVTVLLYDFKTHGRVFDKGGAIRYAQERMMADRKDAGHTDVLLLDSDIYLPDNFSTLIGKITVKPDTLYGCKRLDYYSHDAFLRDVPDHIYKPIFVGYFQLYKASDKYMYQCSTDASCCDERFTHLFSCRRIVIPNLTVKHLGRACVNWTGRKQIDYQR